MSKLSFLNSNIILMLFYFGSTTSNTNAIPNQFLANQTFHKRQSFCIGNHVQNVIEKFVANTITYFDTLTKDDIVQQQYALLPYPAVKPGEFEKIRQHYNSDRKNIPMMIAPAVTLENINHFLFQGRQNFRWLILTINTDKYIYHIHFYA